MRGKLKSLFFALRLHYLIPSNIFAFLGYLSEISKFIQTHKNIGFSDFYSNRFNYKKRELLFEHVIKEEHLDTEIDYLEFGVSTGNSFKWWTNNIKNKDARFYGFDTFSGLPEDWGPFKAGDMSNGNSPPKIKDNRITFYQGIFQQTLIPFLINYRNKNRKIIHLDADLYSSTLYVLTLITPYLNTGDIIFFDEFNVPMHEYKAFSDWSKSFYIQYEILGSVNNFYQIALKIK